MNNDVYVRLLSLFETADLAGEGGSAERAEMRAYAACISLLQAAAEDALREALAETMGEKGILMYCALLNIRPCETQQETKEKIISALSKGFYMQSTDEFEDAENSVPGYSITHSLSGKEVTVSPVSTETLAALSTLVNEYYPAFYIPNLTGNGLDFDELEAFGYRWYELDALHLPFYIWEGLGAQ